MGADATVDALTARHAGGEGAGDATAVDRRNARTEEMARQTVPDTRNSLVVDRTAAVDRDDGVELAGPDSDSRDERYTRRGPCVNLAQREYLCGEFVGLESIHD